MPLFCRAVFFSLACLTLIAAPAAVIVLVDKVDGGGKKVWTWALPHSTGKASNGFVVQGNAAIPGPTQS